MRITNIFAFGLALVGTAFTLWISAGPAMAAEVAPQPISIERAAR
jgi:hypothetical protein